MDSGLCEGWKARKTECFVSFLSVEYVVISPRNSSQAVDCNEMGNLESSAKINVGQLQGLSSRELNISRSLEYEEYQQVRGSTLI